MTTTPRPWKSLTQVNTTDGGLFQHDGHIAALPDGGYVVAWTDDSGAFLGGGHVDGRAIIGQRYDAAGNKIGGEVPIGIPVFSFDHFSGPVAVLSNGYIAVTDAVFNNDGLRFDLYVQIYDSMLNFVRTDVIDDLAELDTFDPSITALAGGGYVVSYTYDLQGPPGLTGVHATIVRGDGSVNFFFIGSESDNQDQVALATLSNGNFAVVFRDEFGGNPNDTDIKFEIRTPLEVMVAGDRVTGAGGPGRETDPDVAALRDGGFVVVWTDPDGPAATDIRATILSNGGNAVASSILVNTSTAGLQNTADVVALADGGFFVSWDDESANLVRAQRFDALGDKIGAELTVKSGISLGGPEAALLGDGRIAFAVGHSTGGDADVMTSIWTTGWNAVATGDFNHDGTKDIIWQNAVGQTSEWLMSPSGGVGSNPFIPGSSGWNVVATGDFNGDGTADLLWKHAVTGVTSEWLMSNGALAANPFIPGAQGWDVVATGDFNHDGTTDVIWKNATSGAVSEWLMSPGGGIASNPFLPSALGWDLVASGDFNGDGTDDLVWKNAANGQVSEWLMSGGGLAGNPFIPGAQGWNLAATGDFNGDNILDLLWQNSAGVTSEWLMAPSGGVGSFGATPLATGWNVVASGDFNGDGTDDLLWKNAASGVTSEWLMSNGAIAANPFIPGAQGWDVVSTGDYNGDAIVDVMWQNALNGATSEWLMSPGGGIASNPFTPFT